MKPRHRMLLRAVVSIFMVLVAAAGSFLIKDFLSLSNPQNALPKIQVSVGGSQLPSNYLVLASYSWRFLLVPHEEITAPTDVWADIESYPAPAGQPLEIGFSYHCKEMYVSRLDEGSTMFLPVSGADGGLYTPTPPEPGTIYVYRVEAFWGWLGSVQYYFTLYIV